MSVAKYFGFEKCYRTTIISDKPCEPACCNPIAALCCMNVNCLFSIVGVKGSCFKTLFRIPCFILSRNLLSYFHWKSGDIFPKCLKSRDADDKICIILHSPCVFISHKSMYSKNISNSFLFIN